MQELINEYFIKPIIDPTVTGYNLVNTLFYVIILIIASALIYKFLKNKVKFDSNFFIALIPYILFGVSLRVIMHQIEANKLVIDFITKTPNPLELGFWFFTPGVWIATFLFVIIGLLISEVHKELKTKRFMIFGILIMLPVLIFNLIQFNNWIIFILTTIIILITTYGLCYLIERFSKYKILKDKTNFFIVLGQGIDGIASSIAVSFFAFSEQHLVSDMIMQIHPGLFIIIKLALGVLIAHSLDDYVKDEPKHTKIIMFVKIIIAIVGLAVGMGSLLKLGIV